MRNIDKYKTAQERAEAFRLYCKSLKGKCHVDRDCDECRFAWLNLECEEEKPLPCPFCGKEFVAVIVGHGAHEGQHAVECYNREDKCCYCGPWKDTETDAIAAHNSVAKKCREVR